MSAPDVVITICPPFAVVASKELIVDVVLSPRKSFETTLNGAARFAELILTLPVTVTGKVSLVATADAASVPPTKLVFGSTVSVNVTPVASMPLAVMSTLYFSVSPGSAFPSISTSVNKESALLAVTVGATGAASLGPGPKELFGFRTFDCVFDLLATLAVLLSAAALPLGWAFHNHPKLRDSTETENTTAAHRATPAINNAATCRFGLIKIEFLRE